MNGSLDFLNMIRNGQGNSPVKAKGEATGKGGSLFTLDKTDKERVSRPVDGRKNEPKTIRKNDGMAENGRIAVIDTETNWHDEVMSLGIAIADAATLKCVGRRYYIFEPEVRVGGIYSNVLYKCDVEAKSLMRDEAVEEIMRELDAAGVTRIFAYNGKFDLGHMPELSGYEWYDIMRLAAYRQYNSAIPASADCCKTGRLKTSYGVEPIMRMLTGNTGYCEVHNAVCDAVDELKIMELLGHGLEVYKCARI